MRRHGFLLGSLILGASILVWLTLIGSVIVAVEVAREQNDNDAGPNTVYVHQPGLDSYGVPCSQSESKSGC